MKKIILSFVLIVLTGILPVSAAFPKIPEGDTDNPVLDIKLSLKTKLYIFQAVGSPLLKEANFLNYEVNYANGKEEKGTIELPKTEWLIDYIASSNPTLELSPAANITTAKIGTENITVSEDSTYAKLDIEGPDLICDLDGTPYFREAYGFLPNIDKLEFHEVSTTGENTLGSDDLALYERFVKYDNVDWYKPWRFRYLIGSCKNDLSEIFERDYGGDLFIQDINYTDQLLEFREPWNASVTCPPAHTVWDVKITKLGQAYGYMETIKKDSHVQLEWNGVKVESFHTGLIHIPYPSSEEGKAIVKKLGY